MQTVCPVLGSNVDRVAGALLWIGMFHNVVQHLGQDQFHGLQFLDVQRQRFQGAAQVVERIAHRQFAAGKADADAKWRPHGR